MKYLGYSFYWRSKGKCGLCTHLKSQDKFKRTLKQITKRNNGKGYAWLKQRLSQYIRGWLTYYSLADMKQFIHKTDGWYRRRLRTYIWKSWKKISTKSHNLQKCGINKHQAWQWANTRKGYWHIANSWVLHRAITDESLDRAGYPQIMRLYRRLHRN